nr:MAG TPA: hypothetical protein [Caudoviricetes sp.]
MPSCPQKKKRAPLNPHPLKIRDFPLTYLYYTINTSNFQYFQLFIDNLILV